MAQINEIEIIVNQFFQSLGGWLKWPMLAFTALGIEQFFILLLPTLYWCFDQAIGLRLGIIFMASNTFNSFFKLLFHNPRPYWVSDQVKELYHETSFGIPSGHAQTAATVWGWLAVELKKRWFSILALFLIFMIGISRIYLGAHFLSDVLLGWIIGGLLVWAFSAWYEKVAAKIKKLSLGIKLLLIFVSDLALGGLVYLGRWFARSWQMNPAWVERAGEVDPLNVEGIFTLGGTWIGMLSGYLFLSKTRGHFQAAQGGWLRLVRFIVGLTGVLIVYLGLGTLFPDNGDSISFILRFIRYTFIGLWVSWFGPLVFEKLGLLVFNEEPA
jgi:membrane-associated phospholipid phosphatase